MKRASAMLALVFLILLMLAPTVAPYDPELNVCNAFQAPNAEHWLGCNDMGQDLFSRLLAGSPLSLSTGLACALLCVLIATAVALLSSQRGGITDQVLMRTVDLMLALPFLPLVIVLAAFWGPSGDARLWVLVFTLWPVPVRELRSQLLEFSQRGYVRASQQMGANLWQVSRWHLLPELLPLLVPQFVRIAYMAILLEAALAFLGLGDPQQLSWGSMLNQANNRGAFLNDSWQWWVVPPGLMIGLAVASLSLLGLRFDGSQASINLPTNQPPTRAETAVDTSALLQVRQLSFSYSQVNEAAKTLNNISFTLPGGSALALIGESGSGKSTLLRALLGLLPTVQLKAQQVTLQTPTQLITLDQLSAQQWSQVRGKEIAYVPQNAMNALDPVKTIGWQLRRAARHLPQLQGQALQQHCQTLLQEMGLSPALLQTYPHQLSGGMRQRVVLAIALCSRPRILLADEATSGLDVVTREEILQCLQSYRRQHELSLILVSHDIHSAARYCDQVGVMLNGELVELNQSAALTDNPQHPHTQALLQASFSLHGQRYWSRTHETAPNAAQPLLQLDLPRFRYHSGFALSNIQLSLQPGEVVGLVGSSGSGKTTLAQILAGQLSLQSGCLRWHGATLSTNTMASYRHAVHTIQQDPYQSLRNDLSLYDAVREPLRIFNQTQAQQQQAVTEALQQVQLPTDQAFLLRPVSSLSGGQRQRLAFARALVQKPQVLIADEPTSMLDTSLQRGLLEQLEAIRQQQRPAMLFITHDLALARHFCDRLLVMDQGKVIEEGVADQVCTQPQHQVTQQLQQAALA